MSRLRALLTPLALGSLAIVCEGCVSGDVNMTVAPNLGKETECVEPLPLAQDSKDWLGRHPEPAPQSWYDYEDYQADHVTPKLILDCQ